MAANNTNTKQAATAISAVLVLAVALLRIIASPNFNQCLGRDIARLPSVRHRRHLHTIGSTDHQRGGAEAVVEAILPALILRDRRVLSVVNRRLPGGVWQVDERVLAGVVLPVAALRHELRRAAAVSVLRVGVCVPSRAHAADPVFLLRAVRTRPARALQPGRPLAAAVARDGPGHAPRRALGGADVDTDDAVGVHPGELVQPQALAGAVVKSVVEAALVVEGQRGVAAGAIGVCLPVGRSCGCCR